MAGEFKQAIWMALGFVDYLRDKVDELREEWIERGERKSEDFREFFDDIFQNLNTQSRSGKGGDESRADGEDFLSQHVQVSVRESLKDVVDSLGLATGSDLKDLSGRLDHLQELASKKKKVKK